MEFITDVVPPSELTGFVREQTDGALPFSDLFPVQPTDNVEFELTQLPSVAGDVARYRSWDTVPPVGKRPTVTIVGSEIPPLSWSYRLNEKEVVLFDQLVQGLTDRAGQAVADRIFGDAANAGHAVQNRITLAHGELLQTGKVTLTELGDPVTGNAIAADYGVPGTHFATAATLWSDRTNSTPVTNLVAWEKVFRKDNNGLNPDAWLVSPDVMADLALNAQIRTQIGATGVAVPSIVAEDIVAQALRLGGVKAPVVVSDVQRPALDGSGTAAVLGARKVIGVRVQDLGTTLYGMPAAASLLANQGQIDWADAPGIVAYALRMLRPAHIITEAQAVAIPALRNPNGIFVGTV